MRGLKFVKASFSLQMKPDLLRGISCQIDKRKNKGMHLKEEVKNKMQIRMKNFFLTSIEIHPGSFEP